jgi:hypothetical protein
MKFLSFPMKISQIRPMFYTFKWESPEKPLVRLLPILPEEEGKTRVEFRCHTSDRESLFQEIKKLNLGDELKVEWGKGWILFFKIREGQTRSVVAHPEAQEWVASIAFSIEDLKQFETRWSDSLESWADVGFQSNLYFKFRDLEV